MCIVLRSQVMVDGSKGGPPLIPSSEFVPRDPPLDPPIDPPLDPRQVRPLYLTTLIANDFNIHARTKQNIGSQYPLKYWPTALGAPTSVAVRYHPLYDDY